MGRFFTWGAKNRLESVPFSHPSWSDLLVPVKLFLIILNERYMDLASLCYVMYHRRRRPIELKVQFRSAMKRTFQANSPPSYIRSNPQPHAPPATSPHLYGPSPSHSVHRPKNVIKMLQLRPIEIV